MSFNTMAIYLLFGAVPIGHSVCLREEHGDVKRVTE